MTGCRISALQLSEAVWQPSNSKQTHTPWNHMRINLIALKLNTRNNKFHNNAQCPIEHIHIHSNDGNKSSAKQIFLFLFIECKKKEEKKYSFIHIHIENRPIVLFCS